MDTGTAIAVGAAIAGWLAAASGWAAYGLQRRTHHLLERQVAGEEAERERAQLADLRVVNGGREGLGYRIEVRNYGGVPASDLAVLLVNPQTGETLGSADQMGLVEPGGAAARVVVAVSEETIKARLPAVVRLRWHDSDWREKEDRHSVAF